MSKATFKLGTVAILLAINLGVAGCATSTPSRSHPETRQSVSPQMREHQQKQRMRAVQGNYKRLYRPKNCGFDARNCNGFPRLGPSETSN